MSNNSVCNVTLGGVGGQGILKASEILGWAAMLDGNNVKKSEVHGMAQRGGSVESHLRFGKDVYSPLIPEGGADFLVCFHKDEHKRLKKFLKKEGTDLVDYLDEAEKQVKDSPKCLNTFLIGVLSSRLDIEKKCWLDAIKKVFPKKFYKMNKGFFLKGRELGQS